MKTYRWEVECVFKNAHMAQYGQKRKVVVTAVTEAVAKHEARVKVCQKLGLSTMFYLYVEVITIRNLDEPKKRSPVSR